MKAIIVMVALGLLVAACAQTEATNTQLETGPAETAPTTEPSMGTSDVKTFVMTGENFKFVMNGEDNPTLTVQQGDRVRIEFSSTDGFHDWVVDEFSAATEKVRPEDGVTVVEFTADQAGEFEYYCSVGSHRANGMWGTLIVE